MHTLLTLDYAILHFINVSCAVPALDPFWRAVSHLDRQSWFRFIAAPLLLAWLIYLCRWGTVKVVLAVALAVGAADLLAYRVIKHEVYRSRPFHNLQISSWVRKVGDAHGSSFPSNHAANCFAGAVVLAWYFRRARFYLYSFAGLVGLSRLTLGVHFPSDVVAGALLGLAIGFAFRQYILERYSWWRVKTS